MRIIMVSLVGRSIRAITREKRQGERRKKTGRKETRVREKGVKRQGERSKKTGRKRDNGKEKKVREERKEEERKKEGTVRKRKEEK